MLAWPSQLQCKLREKSVFLHMFYYMYTAFQLPKLNFFICCKAITRLCKNVFIFTYNFYVSRYENCLQKCPIFRFFQSENTSDLRVRYGFCQSEAIQSRFCQSGPIRSEFCQSDPIRSDPVLVLLTPIFGRFWKCTSGNIFTSLCCNCDTKRICKRSFSLT